VKHDFYNSYQRLLSLTNLQTKQYTDSKTELHASLDRVRDFLKLLGSPEKKLKFVHVGGTSGKGSVLNYLHEIFLNDGKSVATYTSPHTSSFLERFRVNDLLIDPNLLAECMDDIYTRYELFLKKGNNPLSFFELSTCLAMYAFKKAGVDWCLLEVGCGGRFDATNIITTPKVAVITNINKDHTEILGSSLHEIAFEKAGIIKKDGTVYCGENRAKLKKVFMKEAAQKDATLFFVQPPDKQLVHLDRGTHQQHNAALAKCASLEVGIKESVINSALAHSKPLPCRFELIQSNPTIVLDGAHSPAKIEATVHRIKDLFGSAHVIYGSVATKDNKRMIDALVPISKSITTTRFQTPFRKTSNPAPLETMVPASKRGGSFLDYNDALAHVKKIAKKNEAIVVTGSLYLAGEMRKLWISEDDIVKNRSSL
jgi:dihydrofolate synthase / folylpolyglutamate synthase